MAKIRKMTDYFHPKNINLLRKCNFKYGDAHTHFKKARKSNRKEDWNDAYKLYDDYLKNYNTIDSDAKYEIAICIFMLACLEDNKNKQERTFTDSFNRLIKLIDDNETDFSFKKKLWQLYTIRKEHRDVIKYYRGQDPSNNDWSKFSKEQKREQIEKIKMELES